MHEKASSPLLKTIGIQISITFGGIIFALLITEVAFRLFWPAPAQKWQDRPAKYFIPEEAPSFQDYAHQDPKPAGTYRIAAIGDSFTFAPYMQFDDAYPKRLERWFNMNSHQPKVEVINYGVPAYSTNHEVPVVKKAIETGSDLLLMQITLNDPEVKPYTPQELFREKNKFGELELNGPLWLWWRSGAFIRKRIHNRGTQTAYKEKFFNLFEKPDTWSNFKSSWEKAAGLAKEASKPMVAVIFPLFGYPVDDNYPFWPIHKKVAALLESLSVPYLDLTEIYRGIPLERMQVLPGEDFHPNEIAHRMAAEAMYTWFTEKEFVPKEIVAKFQGKERIGIKKPAL